MHEEDVEAIVDVLDWLNHTLPDEDQLHRLELSRPELILEIQESLSNLEKDRIKDLKEIKRLKKEKEARIACINLIFSARHSECDSEASLLFVDLFVCRLSDRGFVKGDMISSRGKSCVFRLYFGAGLNIEIQNVRPFEVPPLVQKNLIAFLPIGSSTYGFLKGRCTLILGCYTPALKLPGRFVYHG